MRPFWKLSAAGFAATAMTYGPARMGFGLFLPDFRAAFAMSTGTAGLVSGLGFLGFLMGLLIGYALISRRGPRLPVVVGLGTATLGMGLVSLARDVPMLAAGIFLAMSSAGFSWAPFNNAVHRRVGDAARPGALAVVSTGTSLGVAAAGATALLLDLGGMSWRVGWAAFAGFSAFAAAGNWVALRDLAGRPARSSDERWAVLFQASAIPLYIVALSFGTTTAIYISFAADRIAQEGGASFVPSSAAPAVVFVSYGLLGLIGLATGRVKAALGLSRLLRLLLLVSALSHLLVALSPNSGAGIIVSAGLQGVYVMMMSAVLAFWSERLFPALPSLSFTAALLAVAAGSVVGPVGAGLLAGVSGSWSMFLAAAAISTATVAAALRRFVRERANPPDEARGV